MAFASIFHKRYPRLYMRVNSLPVIITFVTALVIWGILRNFFVRYRVPNKFFCLTNMLYICGKNRKIWQKIA